MLNAYTEALMAVSSHVTASLLLEKLDRISSQYRTTNKAIVRWTTVEMSGCGNVADADIFLSLKYLVTPETLELFNYKRNGSLGSFSLDNLLTANRLKRLQTKLSVIFSCQSIQIRVIEGIPEHTLNAVITSEFEAAAKDALHSSYDDATRTLNLSRFHAKPELTPYFCPLYVDKFLEGVLRLISKETPQVSKIVLRDNYLCSLKAFSVIPNGLLAGLDCLDISSNNIGDLRELQYLTNLNLKNLILQGNGVANLKNDILAILPQLQNVQRCRQSQNKENVSMGRPKLKLFGSAVPENFVKTFIKDFYQFFDHPDQRSQLEQCYHELATFSLSVTEAMKQVSAYRLYNRNYTSPQSAFARSAKLQVGRKAVVHALGRLPKMETYLPGLNVDIQMSTSHVRILTITGRFTEYSSTGQNLRNFQRNFVLERQESPTIWLIKNDVLCIIPAIENKYPTFIFNQREWHTDDAATGYSRSSHFLQDTSPPSSIVITSADFSNLNFLQSTISQSNQKLSLTTTPINQTDNGINEGRKVLESLTLREVDGTLMNSTESIPKSPGRRSHHPDVYAPTLSMFIQWSFHLHAHAVIRV
ncbi:GL25915 [Drosophila persimilis]|uniref:GL25915 n=1 Tax=Drosophila persimilis TaxID=7234 RepID=B4GJP0_DROPE|nr:GL25915 [Drosophila persimilis]